jgi:hypothetical protein
MLKKRRMPQSTPEQVVDLDMLQAHCNRVGVDSEKPRCSRMYSRWDAEEDIIEGYRKFLKHRHASPSISQCPQSSRDDR